MAMIPIENVDDQVFATKMMEEGVTFELKDDMIYAPIDGKVSLIAATKHALYDEILQFVQKLF